jgi:L-lactate dehydrogenase (cytochrome)
MRDKHLGPSNEEAAKANDEESRKRKKTQYELRVEKARKERPPLSRVLIVQLEGLEDVAKKVRSYKAWHITPQQEKMKLVSI